MLRRADDELLGSNRANKVAFDYLMVTWEEWLNCNEKYQIEHGGLFPLVMWAIQKTRTYLNLGKIEYFDGPLLNASDCC